MSETVRKQAAFDQRRNIPAHVAVIFNETTNEGLLSMESDMQLGPSFRAWSRWELDFRTAMGIYIDFAPDGKLRRTAFATEQEAQVLVERTNREASQVEQNRRRLVREMQERARSGERRGRWWRPPT